MSSRHGLIVIKQHYRGPSESRHCHKYCKASSSANPAVAASATRKQVIITGRGNFKYISTRKQLLDHNSQELMLYLRLQGCLRLCLEEDAETALELTSALGKVGFRVSCLLDLQHTALHLDTVGMVCIYIAWSESHLPCSMANKVHPILF